MRHRGIGVVVVGTVGAVDDIDKIDAELQLGGVLLVGIGDIVYGAVGLFLDGLRFGRYLPYRLRGLLSRLVKRDIDAVAASPAPYG